MIITIALCAVLCAVTLVYILAPKLRDKRGSIAAFTGIFLTALCALGLYLWMGQPALTGGQLSEAELMAQDEIAIHAALEKNPNDAEALLRLAALQVYKNENDEKTLELLDRAEKQLPGDERIKFIRYMIKVPAAPNP